MESAAIARDYLRAEPSPVLAPPIFSRGAPAWLRANLFSGVWSTLLTLGSVAFLAWALPGVIRYLFIDAIWIAPEGAPCRAPEAGACWAYVAQKFSYFMYGSYPREEVWRVDLVLVIAAGLIAWLLWPDAKRKAIGALLFFIVFPLLAAALLVGANPFGFYRVVGWGRDRLYAVPDLLFGMGDALVRDMSVLADRLQARGGGIDLDAMTAIAGIAIDFHAMVGAAFALCVVAALAVLLLMRRPAQVLMTIGVVALLSETSKPVEWAWDRIGLTHVPTDLWGGVFVSLLVSVIGIVVSLPGGILLALGRRSRLPIIRFCSIAFIEFVRGVPLITVLFMANLMLPLFVPAHLSPDRLARPLIGISLFASAYMAEVIRGGLQAMPRGQFEGGMAVGLSYWQMMRLIILPQALTIVIPGIVNTFIGLFKDTTLVAIVGISDFLRTVDTARLDPAWAGPTISTTGYLFAALFYFVFCFGMSRYSAMIEQKLATGRKR